MAYPPRAMKADRAAAYLDMSRSKFLELVEADRLPKPKIIDGIRVWDRLALNSAFNDFPERGGDDNLGRRNTFDDVLPGMRKMATMKLRYVHSFVDKTGRVRFYFRHRGQRWPLPGQPGSAELGAAAMMSYDAIVSRQAKAMLRSGRIPWVRSSRSTSTATISNQRRITPSANTGGCLDQH